MLPRTSKFLSSRIKVLLQFSPTALRQKRMMLSHSLNNRTIEHCSVTFEKSGKASRWWRSGQRKLKTQSNHHRVKNKPRRHTEGVKAGKIETNSLKILCLITFGTTNCTSVCITTNMFLVCYWISRRCLCLCVCLHLCVCVCLKCVFDREPTIKERVKKQSNEFN